MEKGEFRICTKKLKLTYPKEIPCIIIYNHFQNIEQIENFKMIKKENASEYYFIFRKKLNTRNSGLFIINYNKIHYKFLDIETLKAVFEIPEKIFIDDAINLFFRVILDRDDEIFIEMLKEDPQYQVLRMLNLSPLHIISSIICNLYAPHPYQKLKLQSIKEKIYRLPYLNFCSNQALILSINNLESEDLRHCLNVLRGF